MVLHYGPNKLYFVAGKLESIALHDVRWIIGECGAPGFWVGSILAKTALTADLGAPLVFGNFEVENKLGKSCNFTCQAISISNY